MASFRLSTKGNEKNASRYLLLFLLIYGGEKADLHGRRSPAAEISLYSF